MVSPPVYVRRSAYRSPARANVVSALLGAVLVAAGVYLAAKYGFEAAAYQIEHGRTAFNQVVFAAIGGGLLLSAVILNAWSSWSTLIPGLVLVGIGGWAFSTPQGLASASRWTQEIFTDHQMSNWFLVGFTLILGLVLLGSSISATVLRRLS